MERRKIRIAFIYIIYPFALARYMLEALYRRPDVEVWVAGPFSGRQIPWLGGMFLPKSYVRKPDLALPMSQPPQVIYPHLHSEIPWRPDIWIEANAGLATIGRPIEKYVVIGTDPHVLNYSKAREEADIFFCMQKAYGHPGDLWLPYAYDPIWHSKTNIPWDAREYDISLVGLPYPNRRQLIERLRMKGLSVYLKNGPCYTDARDIYHSSRLGLNWSSRFDMNARVFELMGFGICQVMNRVPDLAELFIEDEHYIGFDTMEEAEAKILEILGKPHEAQQIAQNANELVQDIHTWDSRMEAVLSIAGVLDDEEKEGDTD